jgi:hypothetical protein
MEMKELGSTMIRAALCTVLASPAVQEQPSLALGAVAATAAGSLDYYTVQSKQAPGRGISMKGIFAGAHNRFRTESSAPPAAPKRYNKRRLVAVRLCHYCS